MDIPLFINSPKTYQFCRVLYKNGNKRHFSIERPLFLRGARNDREARETPRSPRVARKAAVIQATWTPKIK